MTDGNHGGSGPTPSEARRLPWIYRAVVTTRIVQLALKSAREGLNKPVMPGDTINLKAELSITWMRS